MKARLRLLMAAAAGVVLSVAAPARLAAEDLFEARQSALWWTGGRRTILTKKKILRLLPRPKSFSVF